MALMRMIRSRLCDQNFQSQLTTAESLRSLAHLKNFTLTPNGVDRLLESDEGARIRLSAQLLLNCPGSLARREQDLIICTSCSSPVTSRNVFLHRALDCVNTSEKKGNYITNGLIKLCPYPYNYISSLVCISGKKQSIANSLIRAQVLNCVILI